MAKKTIKKDYRIGSRVVCTLQLADEGQDFTELDVLTNEVILGNSPMFSNGRQSLLGIGTLNGDKYFSAMELLEIPILSSFTLKSFKGLYVYIYDTATLKPLPWDATYLKYKVVGVKKAIKPNRFIKENGRRI